MAQKHRNLRAISNSTRKIFGTVLRQAGLEPEYLDALSGCVPVGAGLPEITLLATSNFDFSPAILFL
jgi:hypothetical protein